MLEIREEERIKRWRLKIERREGDNRSREKDADEQMLLAR
jgi:hypothetical protein